MVIQLTKLVDLVVELSSQINLKSLPNKVRSKQARKWLQKPAIQNIATDFFWSMTEQ